ncbi:MAG: DMT family transporter, partial [Clostridiales Family XIII bacterium]|nr:DMT family transporter [Clostridiales Family XIII bacterium]
MNNTIKSTVLLTLTAMIWGLAFVAQRSSMDYIGPFFFNGVRSLLGALTLILFLYFSGLRTRAAKGHKGTVPLRDPGSAAGVPVKPAFLTEETKTLLKGGGACGAILFAGSSFQQVGLVFTTASKAGFITALYIVLVPILGIFLKHKTHWNTWAGVLLAAFGLYCLCLTENLDIALGDLIVFSGAGFWALHILVIDHFVTRVGAVRLSCVQFLVCGILSLIVSVAAVSSFGGPLTPEIVLAARPAILDTGSLSSGGGFSLQAVGPKYA